MKNDKILAIVVLLFAFAILSRTSGICEESQPKRTISGQVEMPIAFFDDTPSVAVGAYLLDDNKEISGDMLAVTTTDVLRNFRMVLPPGINEATNLIVGIGEDYTQARTIVATDTVKITPITELVATKVMESEEPLSNFSIDEIISIQAQADKDAENLNYESAETVEEAITILYSGELATNLDEGIAEAGKTSENEGSESEDE